MSCVWLSRYSLAWQKNSTTEEVISSSSFPSGRLAIFHIQFKSPKVSLFSRRCLHWKTATNHTYWIPPTSSTSSSVVFISLTLHFYPPTTPLGTFTFLLSLQKLDQPVITFSHTFSLNFRLISTPVQSNSHTLILMYYSLHWWYNSQLCLKSWRWQRPSVKQIALLSPTQVREYWLSVVKVSWGNQTHFFTLLK